MKNVNLELRETALTCFCARSLIPFAHLHKEIELVYVKKGHTLCFADSNFYEISDGDIFLSFPNQTHYYLNCELGEYYVLIFSPNILYNIENIFFENLPVNNIFKAQNNSPFTELVSKIYCETGEFKETIQIGLLNQLIPTLLSYATLKPKLESDSPALRDILNFCSQNFTNDISLDDVANALHLSKYHISHLLNQRLKTGFNQYLNTLRIHEACDLMESSDKSMAFISEEVGFGSIRSFNRAFSQIMNTTPLKYRKQIKNNHPKSAK